MKSDRKDIYNVKKNLYFKQMLGFFFLTFYLSKNAGKNIYIMVSTKNIKQHNCFQH